MEIQEIKKHMKNNRITYNDLSQMTGLSISTIKKIFSGISQYPRIDTIRTIERALDIDSIKQLSISTEQFSKEEQELLTAFRSLNGSMRAYVLQIVKSAVYAQEETAENKMTNNIKKIGG